MNTTEATPATATATATATDELAALRSRAKAGEPVTAEEIATATAAVELERLVQGGHRSRAAKAAALAADERRESAKSILGRSISPTLEAVEAAKADLIAAMVALVTAIEEHSDEIYRTASALEDAGFVSRVNISTAKNEGVDPNWCVVYDAGDMGRAASVRVDGTSYLPMDAGKSVVEALKMAVDAVGAKFSYLRNLPVKYETSLRNRLMG